MDTRIFLTTDSGLSALKKAESEAWKVEVYEPLPSESAKGATIQNRLQ